MIRVLAAELADAIAAGEVLERPAAAVKELVENALDAGAGRVSVEIRGSGKILIRVADDGAGIPPDDLDLAFVRHATSKISALADLGRIQTLGFRGEALASIAAVSDLECRSGSCRVQIRFGQTLARGVCPPAGGTVMEVRDLFSNTPARLKFLKTDATEAGLCQRTVQTYALFYPGVRFELSIDGRVAFRTLGTGGRAQAATAVLGPRVAKDLIGVEGSEVSGLVSPPSINRGNRDAILLAVNHRPIVSRALSFAVEECYSGLLERGRHPIVALDLKVDEAEVDVNVHPTKREVRFQSEGAVFGAVQRTVLAALGSSAPPRMLVAMGTPAPVASAARGWGMASSAGAPPQASDLDLQSALDQPPSRLRAVGQIGVGYLVAESAEGLMVVDQHAAHERVLYNRIVARLQAGAVASQPLLLTEVVELDPLQMAGCDQYRNELKDFGFVLEPFGPQSVRIESAPADVPPARAAAALEEMLAVMGRSEAPKRLEQAAATLACHAAVRFGDQLDQSEQSRLLMELESTDLSITCPHGRPTRLLLDWQDLRRHFRRTY